VPTRFRQRDIAFHVAADHLVRTVTFPDGRAYTHRCTLETYKQALYAIEACGADGFTLQPLAKVIHAPYTQVSVALDFLLERGCLVKPGRRNFAASSVLFEDGMCEYHALEEMPEHR